MLRGDKAGVELKGKTAQQIFLVNTFRFSMRAWDFLAVYLKRSLRKMCLSDSFNKTESWMFVDVIDRVVWFSGRAESFLKPEI